MVTAKSRTPTVAPTRTVAPTKPVTSVISVTSVTSVTPVASTPTTVAPASQKPTPSAGLAAAAAAQGITLADLETLSPADLASLQAAFDSGAFN